MILDKVYVAYSNCLADVCVEAGHCPYPSTVLRAAALPSITSPLVGLLIVNVQVREPSSSSLVISKLGLRRLRQLRQILHCYIWIDVLPETVAICNVLANE